LVPRVLDPDALLILPEYYYYPGEFGSVEAIYNNRKILESNVNLHEWITTVFAEEGFGHIRLFTQPHPRREPERFPSISPHAMKILPDHKTKVVFCHFIRPLGFGIVYGDGEFYFFALSLDAGQFSLKKGTAVRFKNLAIVTLSPSKNEILSYDREFLRIHTMSDKWAHEALLKNPRFSERMCQISRSSLRRLPEDSQSVTMKLPEAIVCFASSAKFNVTAVGCQDGKLRIRSNETGLKVATISLDGEIPSSILITPKWGFIVVFTGKSLFLFSVNGVLGKKVPYPRVVQKWFTFYDRDGFDFIAFVDVNGRLQYFDAMEPEHVTEIAYEGTLVGFDYIARYNCFFIVSESGNLSIVPRP
jgi:hypothetical protein